MDFESFVARASGESAGGSRRPYPYQVRLAEEGLPELLRVPTGAGKTAAAVLGWLYRRRFHPDDAVRAATPHWLVFTLPMRVLVEQVHAEVDQWLDNLGVPPEEVGRHRLMGGELGVERAWRTHPERDAVFVATLDMALSRALNRGYGESRWTCPIDFGLFNNGVQWVFDEVQLMGPALPTSLQLDGLRAQLGVAAPSRSMWMSATVDDGQMATVDHPGSTEAIELSDADRASALGERLAASKTVRRLEDGELGDLPAVVIAKHRPGTRTIAFINTVDRASTLATGIRKADPSVPVVLVHSRFRPGDRANVVAEATADVDPGGPGVIVVTTQVLEAGVDVSSSTLITEVAPWSSLVQRMGRCNRAGHDADATVWWLPAPKAPPYDESELEAAEQALADLEKRTITADGATLLGPPQVPPLHHVLRRRDLLELFDTLPDLSGNDIDVGRFLRDGDDLDVQVAWRRFDDDPDPRTALPAREERCSVPVGELRRFLTTSRSPRAWRYDHLSERWVRCVAGDVRPGLVAFVHSDDGGYDPADGWNGSSRAAVEPVAVVGDGDPLADEDLAVDADPVTFMGRWVALQDHLAHVEHAAKQLFDALGPPGLTNDQIDAAVRAAALHDIGKAHPVFQAMLADAETATDLTPEVLDLRPWAKSASGRGGRRERRYFRHELASALALLAIEDQLSDEELDLVLYLVASHHGRVRLGARSLHDERDPDGLDRKVMLGVVEGDVVPEVDTPSGRLPATVLSLSTMEVGGAGERPSWGQRALGLRDRPDLGPFRLGFLEAAVRLSDWRASRLEQEGELS